MKAKLYDKIKLLEDITGDFTKQTILKGTKGTIVDCHSNPEGYTAEFKFKNSQDKKYTSDTATLYQNQFRIIRTLIKVLSDKEWIGHRCIWSKS